MNKPQAWQCPMALAYREEVVSNNHPECLPVLSGVKDVDNEPLRLDLPEEVMIKLRHFY